MDRPYPHGRSPRPQNRSRHELGKRRSRLDCSVRSPTNRIRPISTAWTQTGRGRAQVRSGKPPPPYDPPVRTSTEQAQGSVRRRHPRAEAHSTKAPRPRYPRARTSTETTQRSIRHRHPTRRGPRHRSATALLSTCPHQHEKDTALNPTSTPHTQRAAAPKRRGPTIHVSAQPEAQSDVVAETVLRLTSGWRALPAQGWERTHRTHQSRRLPHLGGALITIGSQGHNRQVHGGNCGRILSRHPNPTPPNTPARTPAYLSPEMPSPASGSR